MRSWSTVLDSLFLSLPLLWRLLVIAALMLLMAVFAMRKRFLSTGGTAAAVILGFIVMYLGAVSAIVMLIFFFLSCSILGRLQKDDGISAKGSRRRDMMQVVANGLPAAMALLAARFSSNPDIFLAAFAAAIAEAEADTFSGEIGRLSHSDPVSIITFTKVPKGISGGVSVLGFLAGMGGSLLIALLFMGTYGCSVKSFLAIAASGFLGSVLDSFLGAAVQVQYRRKDGTLTERSEENGERNERARGIPWMDNDAVNLISGAFAAAVCALLLLPA